jgi:hypothetical protein
MKVLAKRKSDRNGAHEDDSRDSRLLLEHDHFVCFRATFTSTYLIA